MKRADALWIGVFGLAVALLIGAVVVPLSPPAATVEGPQRATDCYVIEGAPPERAVDVDVWGNTTGTAICLHTDGGPEQTVRLRLRHELTNTTVLNRSVTLRPEQGVSVQFGRSGPYTLAVTPANGSTYVRQVTDVTLHGGWRHVEVTVHRDGTVTSTYLQTA